MYYWSYIIGIDAHFCSRRLCDKLTLAHNEYDLPKYVHDFRQINIEIRTQRRDVNFWYFTDNVATRVLFSISTIRNITAKTEEIPRGLRTNFVISSVVRWCNVSIQTYLFVGSDNFIEKVTYIIIVNENYNLNDPRISHSRGRIRSATIKMFRLLIRLVHNSRFPVIWC